MQLSGARQLKICIRHREWSLTESLELGFYRDEKGNAKCYAVGSNAPNDFSYISEIETASDWTYLGFRTALVPVEISILKQLKTVKNTQTF